jgi:cobalt-zinc-cadmium efflux system outer membrane protein
MATGSWKRLWWALGFLLLGSCTYPVREHTDLAVQNMANQTIDLEPLPPADSTIPYARKKPAAPPAATTNAGDVRPVAAVVQPDEGLGQLAGEENDSGIPRPLAQPLQLPEGLPGTEAPPIELPGRPGDPDARKKNLQYYRKLYPNMPPVGRDAEPQPGPDGRPLTLADLQRLAMSNSPALRQAAADVQAARGALIQAGAYPNPTFAYESDTVTTAGTAGFQGVFVDQLIKTGGKLKLAQAAAQMDYLNAQLALRRAQTDLITQVRSGYFAVLVAQEGMRVNKILVRFADGVFRIQVLQVTAGAGAMAAPYEPMALRTLANVARIALVQARNHYVSSWKQLAANIGLPGMPFTELAGSIDLPLPRYQYDQVLARVLTNHTDVLTAQNAQQKARFNLRLAQVAPIPDVDVHVVLQKDFSVAPFLFTHGLQVSVPVPIWDHNKGGIIQAEGQLLRATEEAHRVRAALTQSVASAFETYDNNLKIVEKYAREILPDQMRVYKGTYERYRQGPAGEVVFQDVVTAQQNLETYLAQYLTALDAQWQAAVTVANFLQTNDLFGVGQETVDLHCEALRDLAGLKPLPCCHPSTPLSDPRLKGADGSWPPPLHEGPTGPEMPRVPNGEPPAEQAAPLPPQGKRPALAPQQEGVAYIGKEP